MKYSYRELKQNNITRFYLLCPLMQETNKLLHKGFQFLPFSTPLFCASAFLFQTAKQNHSFKEGLNSMQLPQLGQFLTFKAFNTPTLPLRHNREICREGFQETMCTDQHRAQRTPFDPASLRNGKALHHCPQHYGSSPSQPPPPGASSS